MIFIFFFRVILILYLKFTQDILRHSKTKHHFLVRNKLTMPTTW